MEGLWAGTGRVSLERGNMLVVLREEGLVVTHALVVHAAADSFLQWAAHMADAAASAHDAAKFRWEVCCEVRCEVP
jgi:hypothetical protein